MLQAESTSINRHTPMAAAIEYFLCGLCQFVVSPFPRQCSGCHSLYCESCISNLVRWKCPQKNCKAQSDTQPEDMHRSVKEILERLEFDCPGCKTNLRYQEMFAHVKTCAEIKSTNRVDQSQLIKIVAQNTGESQAI